MDLHEQLDDLARGTDVPAGDLDGVIARARHRQVRRRRVAGALAAVAVGTTAFAVTTSSGDDEGTNIAAGGPTSVGETDLAWELVDPDVNLVPWVQATVADELVYALSTAPGQTPSEQPAPLRLWSSSDGIEWRDGGASDGDLYLSDLDAGGSDGRVYAIGTGQAVAATVDGRDLPELRVGHSDDGDSWTTEALDVDLAAVAEHATAFGWGQREVAVSGDGDVLAIVGMYADLDVPSVVPEGDRAPERWAITATGVDVLGERTDATCADGKDVQRSDDGVPGPHRVWPDYCIEDEEDGRGYELAPQETHTVERSYTWEELGVEGDLLAATLNRPLAFLSTDGGAFERIELPLPEGQIGWLGVDGNEEGFDLATAPMGADLSEAHLLQSADGTTWTSAQLPEAMQYVTALGDLAGQTTLIGAGTDNQPVVVLADGHVARPAEELDPALVDGRDVWAAGGAVGDLGIVLVVGLSDPRQGDAEYVILTSADGRSWSQHDLDDIAGDDISTAGTPIVTGDHIVIPVTLDGQRDEDGHLEHRALVARPAA